MIVVKIEGGFIFMTREEIFDESGKIGESIIKAILEENYKLKYIHNYLLRFYGFVKKEGSTEVDFVLVLNKYVYLLEVKHYNCITRYDAKKDEYHVLINKNSRHFRSPVYQNENHRKLISELLGIQQEDIVCISIITTEDSSEYRYVQDYALSAEKRNHLITKDSLVGLIEKYERGSKTNLNRDWIFEKLECSDFSKEPKYREKHENYCDFFKKHKNLNPYRMKFFACKSCGNPLVLREKNGAFFAGCSKYPECTSKTVTLDSIDEYEIEQEKIAERVIYYMSLDEYRQKRQDIIDDISRLEKERLENPESVVRKKIQELKTDYEGKIDIAHKQINRINAERLKLEEKCKKQNEQIKQLTQSLDEERKLNDELSEKLSNTFGAHLRKWFGVKK